VVLTDYLKIGVDYFSCFVELFDIVVVIIDDGLDFEIVVEIEIFGFEVVFV